MGEPDHWQADLVDSIFGTKPMLVFVHLKLQLVRVDVNVLQRGNTDIPITRRLALIESTAPLRRNY